MSPFLPEIEKMGVHRAPVVIYAGKDLAAGSDTRIFGKEIEKKMKIK